ncbi:Katanin p60 ATPase-containing subunit A-like 2, partial [Dinochytrium kinnereticum]
MEQRRGQKKYQHRLFDAIDRSYLESRLINLVYRDIFVENPNVKWGDIAGLPESKRLVREAVVYPIRYP